MQFAVMNVKKNDLIGPILRSLPNIRLYPKNDKENYILFEEEYEFDDIIDFLKEHGL